MADDTWTRAEKKLATRIAVYDNRDNPWFIAAVVGGVGLVAVGTVVTGGTLLIAMATYGLAGAACAGAGLASVGAGYGVVGGTTLVGGTALAGAAAASTAAAGSSAAYTGTHVKRDRYRRMARVALTIKLHEQRLLAGDVDVDVPALLQPFAIRDRLTILRYAQP